MAQYVANLMHGSRGGESKRFFEAKDGLMKKSPVKVVRAFMEWLETESSVGHIDYELNVALKNKEHGVVTAMGEMIFSETNHQPFVLMISKA